MRRWPGHGHLHVPDQPSTGPPISRFAGRRTASRTTATAEYLVSAMGARSPTATSTSPTSCASGAFVPFHDRPCRSRPTRHPARRVSPTDPLLPALLAAPMVLVRVGGEAHARGDGGRARGSDALGGGAPLPRLAAAATVVVWPSPAVSPLVVYGTQVYPSSPQRSAVTAADRGGHGAPRPRPYVLLWSRSCAPVAGLESPPPGRGPGPGDGLVVGSAERGPCSRSWSTLVAMVNLSCSPSTGPLHGLDGLLVRRPLRRRGADRDRHQPDYPSRAVRLANLLVDRQFGPAAWAPVFLFAIPAIAALARRPSTGVARARAALAAGWLNATFIALTMHGWWWPGRQVRRRLVPCIVLAVAWFADQVRRRRRLISRSGRDVESVDALGPWWWSAVACRGGPSPWSPASCWSWLLVEVLRRSACAGHRLRRDPSPIAAGVSETAPRRPAQPPGRPGAGRGLGGRPRGPRGAAGAASRPAAPIGWPRARPPSTWGEGAPRWPDPDPDLRAGRHGRARRS